MKLLKLDLKKEGFTSKEDDYFLCVYREVIFVSRLKYAKLDGVNYVPCVDNVAAKTLRSIYDLDELYLVER